MIVVADLYRLKSRNKEGFQVDGTTELERPKMVVEKSYVDDTNLNSKTSGKKFVIDEEATIKRNSEQEKQPEVNDVNVIDDELIKKKIESEKAK